jgi:hypothetical protein
VAKLLSASFPNLATAEVQVLVQGMFDYKAGAYPRPPLSST